MTAGPSSAPLPAATVVLLRSGPDGALEVLLTQRPRTMAFAADLHVFPGGRVDAADGDPRVIARSVLDSTGAARRLGGDVPPEIALAAHLAAIRELFEEAGVLLAEPRIDAGRLAPFRDRLLAGSGTLADVAEAFDLRLRTHALVPIGHWTTPPIMPRRFDTRFFAADLPAGIEVSFDPREVVGHRWLTPRAGLESMARGEIGMWIPTSATLQQLEHVRSLDEMRERLAPGPAAAPRVVGERPGLTRIVLSAAGAVPGRTVNAYVVGEQERVVVDPGDQTDAAADAILAAATAGGARLVAIALTHADPDHAAGAEALALRLEIPIVGGPGAGRDLPFDVRELADGAPLPGDAGFVAVHAPGPRPEHLAFRRDADGAVLAGDLVGGRPSRAILGPVDDAARVRSLQRLAATATTLYPGHGEPVAASGGE